jgi:hypothetical protein
MDESSAHPEYLSALVGDFFRIGGQRCGLQGVTSSAARLGCSAFQPASEGHSAAGLPSHSQII